MVGAESVERMEYIYLFGPPGKCCFLAARKSPSTRSYRVGVGNIRRSGGTLPTCSRSATSQVTQGHAVWRDFMRKLRESSRGLQRPPGSGFASGRVSAGGWKSRDGVPLPSRNAQRFRLSRWWSAYPGGWLRQDHVGHGSSRFQAGRPKLSDSQKSSSSYGKVTAESR